jgi:thioredoxin 1
MKFIKITLLFASLFFIGINFSSCQNNEKNINQTNKGGKISIDEFEKKLNSNQNAQLIDVRTPEEYKNGFIKGAKNIDWNATSFENEIKKLDKEKAVYVYCLGGGRSGAAAEKMKELGFKEVYDMQGGMMAWNNAGKPVVTTNPVNENPGMSLDDYNKQINSNKLVLIDFNAPWCAPCKKMAPMLEELALEKKSTLNFIKINADENKQLAKSLGIEELPVLIIYKNQKIVWKKTGLSEKAELLKVIEAN